MTQLLNIDANPKTVKGQKHGYMTAVMYLSPYILSGRSVCPFAKMAGCWKTCLNTAGRGGISKTKMTLNGIEMPDNPIQHARLWRTNLWHDNRPEFFRMLVKEIDSFIRKAKRKDLTPVVRLNGTSDIMWEGIKIPDVVADEFDQPRGQTIFEAYPDIQFYDYTKIPKRMGIRLPNNYYLCLSYSGASKKYADMCWEASLGGASMVAVVRDQKTKDKYLDGGGWDTDGDLHDLRFLDRPGAMVVLKAKGSARRENNGFVLE